MTDTPKPKKLTIKQKKFVKAYVANDGNGQEAAKAVYDVKTDEAAAVISSQNLIKVNVKEAIEAALEKHGITMDAAVAPIADGLQAKKFIPDGQGGAIDIPDHTSRLKASGMALKLMGAEQKQGEVPQSVHFHQHQHSQKDEYGL